jgi:hypothetical protein
LATRKKKVSSAGTKKEPRGTVSWRSDWLGGFTTPRDGWAVPRKIQADANLPGGVRVNIEIEVEEGHARARRVSFETDNPRGVGWTALAKAPVRDIVATAVLGNLKKATLRPNGSMRIELPTAQDSEAVREIVQAAVGYRPNTEGFERGE